ncbi:MAG: phosphoribosylglycinamide formyltransferase [Alphaproteobacteria bacterium]
MVRIKTAILISGRGSNMKALINAALSADFPAQIALVASNIEAAGGLAYASDHGIKTLVVNHRNFANRELFERQLDHELRQHQIELVCLAGFMRVLTPWFVEQWQCRLINIHPSLLPLFKGLHTHEAALAAGVKNHGCTVHYVVPDVDAGEIIAQASVPILAGDSPEILAARVLEQEHIIYPQALAKIATALIKQKSH